MLTFHNTKNRTFGKKLLSMLERAITANLRRLIYWKIVIIKYIPYILTDSNIKRLANECFLYGNG